MISTDRLAEAHYAGSDPQFFDEESAVRVKRHELLNDLYEDIERAISRCCRVHELDKTDGIRKIQNMLYVARDLAEKELEEYLG